MNQYNLPYLNDTFLVGPKDHIEITLDSQTLKYKVHYPSNHFVEGLNPEAVKAQISRYNPDPDFLTRLIEYVTNWRRVAYFPNEQIFYSKFPNGRINFGGLGNSKRFTDDYIWRIAEQENPFE